MNTYEGPPFKIKHASKAHSNFANCVRFSPDGERFVSVGSDSKARSGQTDTMKQIARAQRIGIRDIVACLCALCCWERRGLRAPGWGDTAARPQSHNLIPHTIRTTRRSSCTAATRARRPASSPAAIAAPCTRHAAWFSSVCVPSTCGPLFTLCYYLRWLSDACFPPGELEP